jgi:hypothetical protein
MLNPNVCFQLTQHVLFARNARESDGVDLEDAVKRIHLLTVDIDVRIEPSDGGSGLAL